MALPFLIDFIFIGILIVFVVTQIALPILTERPLFPMFNKLRQRLEDKIVQAHEEKDIEELRKELKDTRRNEK